MLQPTPGVSCNGPSANGLTCSSDQLVRVAWCDDHTFDIYAPCIQRCTACGQFYKQVWEGRVRWHYHKPNARVGDDIPFTFEEAVRHGYTYSVQVTTEAECEAAIARFDALTRERSGIDPELCDLSDAISTFVTSHDVPHFLRTQAMSVEIVRRMREPGSVED